MSMAYAVDFVALIIEGANLAMLLGAIGVLIQCTVRVRRKQPIHRAAFSAAAVIIAVQVAGLGWNALGGSLTNLTMTSTAAPVDGVRDHLLHREHLARRRRHRRHVVGVPGARLEPGVPGAAPRRTWSRPLVAGLVALAITNGVFVLLPIVASPLYVCYRGYHRRWTEMATALLNRAAADRSVPATV